jgi:hypothetical protein
MLWYNPILTQTDLNSRIIFGQTPESEVLEFKRELVLSKINGPQGSTNSPAKSVDDNAREFARDIASFANSRGGTIVIGVDEGATTTGQPKAARAFVPVNDVTATLQKIRGDMVTKYLVPSTLDFTVSPISLATGDTVLAVNIPPFVGGIVAVWHSNNKRCVEYPYRTSFGKDYFNPTQAAERIMDAGRSMEIRFRHLCNTVGVNNPSQRTSVTVRLHTAVHLGREMDRFEQRLHWKSIHEQTGKFPLSEDKVKYPPVWDPQSQLSCKIIDRVRSLHEMQFEFVVPDGGRSISIPYSAILDAWDFNGAEIGLMLKYPIRIPIHGHAYLDPS